MNFSLNKKTYIFFFFIIYLIIFSRGSISGDYEKIFIISQKFLNSDLSIFNFLENYKTATNLIFPNEPTFLKHNFFFFLIDVTIIKFFDLIPQFPGSKFFLEYLIALLPGILFTSSILLIYNSYKNKFNSNFLIVSIIFFWFGTYLINFFSSSAFAESYTFFLLSLRIFLIEKNKGKLIIPVIDALLIQIRITCWVLVPFFLYTYFKDKKLNFKNIFEYTFIFLGLILIFYFLLRPIDLDNYYLEKILASFCTDNILLIMKIYFERLIQTFFSFSLGIIFIFPTLIFIIYSLYKNFKINDLIKIFSLITLVLLFALEEYWFLPAGISGNRGIAPFLIFLFPNFIHGFKDIFQKFPKTSIGVVFLCLILFLPSIYFRTTIGTYAVCGQIYGCEIPFRNEVNYEVKYVNYKDNKFKCRYDNSFAMFDIKMHPGIYAYRILKNKFQNTKISKIYLNKNNVYTIDTDYIVPETLGARVIFLLKNELELIDPNKIKLRNIIYKHKNKLYYIIIFLKFLTLISLFTIFFKKSKFLLKNSI